MTSQGFCPTLCGLKFHLTPGLFSEQSKHAMKQRVWWKSLRQRWGRERRSPQDSRCNRERGDCRGFQASSRKKSPSQEGRKI